MPYEYADGSIVNKESLVEGVSTFIYADEASIHYGTAVILSYDDEDGCPRVKYMDTEGNWKDSYMDFSDMIYLGEYGDGKED